MESISSTMPVALQWALFVMVLCAAFTDLIWRRIPNGIVLAGFAAGVGMNWYHGGASGAWAALTGSLLGAALFMGIYLAGGMGGGDVKLFTAVGAMVGPTSLVVVFVLTGILGGGAAVLLLILRSRAREAMCRTTDLLASWLQCDWMEVKRRSCRQASGALSLPYGAVMASGVLLFLFALRHSRG